MNLGKIVQLVELWSPKPKAGGSSPSLSVSLKRFNNFNLKKLVIMRVSFMQFLFLIFLGLLFFADLPRLVKITKQKIKAYKTKRDK